jgi:hypothetical protein
MRIFLAVLIIFTFPTLAMAAEKKGRIVYKYKKYEKFDFSDLVVEGETGSPGDLSISPRYQRRFKNKLPYRRNFSDKIIKAVGHIR